MALNDPTLARVRDIAAKVKAGTTVSTMEPYMGTEAAIHDDVAAADLQAAGKIY